MKITIAAYKSLNYLQKLHTKTKWVLLFIDFSLFFIPFFFSHPSKWVERERECDEGKKSSGSSRLWCFGEGKKKKKFCSIKENIWIWQKFSFFSVWFVMTQNIGENFILFYHSNERNGKNENNNRIYRKRNFFVDYVIYWRQFLHALFTYIKNIISTFSYSCYLLIVCSDIKLWTFILSLKKFVLRIARIILQHREWWAFMFIAREE